MEQNTANLKGNASITAFSVLMSLVVTLGLLGNIATIFVLIQPEHRTKNIAYLQLNLAVSSTIICVIGYPIAISLHSNLQIAGSFLCNWSAFFTATTGIVCIITLSVTSIIQYQCTKQIQMLSQPRNLPRKKSKALVIVAIWIAAVSICIPPMFGWNRFVPVQSGIGCHPDWASQDPIDKAYIWFLVTGGFFAPLTVICVSYGMIFRFMKRLSVGQIGHQARRSRLKRQRAINRMIIAAILAFILSWSPYCIVSLIATFKGDHVTTPELSLIPEVCAKASVIYNPMVFTFFNMSFRNTLLRLISTCLDRLQCKSGNVVGVISNRTRAVNGNVTVKTI